MKSLKVLALILAVIMISTGLSACGGDKKEEKATTAQKQNTDTKKEEEAENTEKNTEETAEGSTADQLKKVLSIGYVGVDNEKNTIYWATDADVNFGALLVVSADNSQKISFVGYIESGEDNQLTITDDKTGNAKTFAVEPIEASDGQKGIQLTSDDGLLVALFSVDVNTVIDAMLAAEAQ